MPKRVEEVATTYGREISTGVAAPLFTRFRLSTHDYHQMIDAGIFADTDSVELIDGELIMMSPMGSKHFACVNVLVRLFYEKIGRQAIISSQGPVHLDEHNEPQPDIALLRPRTDNYAGALPGVADTFLVIEVSDSTLEYDREIKLKAYAHSGIPETWIVNLVDNWFEIYCEPDANGYRLMRRHSAGETLSPAAFADVVLDPKEIIP